MRPSAPLALALAAAILLAGCLGSGPAPGARDGEDDIEIPLEVRFANLTVVLDTSHGEIAIEMLLDKSPVTVANFVQYAENGFYENTIFHRAVVRSNESCIGIVQGGGYTKDLKPKGVNLGPIPLERPRNVSHVEGTVAMARLEEENTATTQFFINAQDSTCLDRAPGYAIFGRVVEGLDVVKRIQGLPTVAREPHANVPAETVTLRRATVHPPVAPQRNLEVASLHEGYKIDPDGRLSLAILVKNLGNATENVTLSATPSDPAIVAAFERATVRVAPREWLPVILRLAAENATAGVANVTVEAKAGALVARHVVTYRVAEVSGAAADAGANGRVKVAYVGLYGNGAVFDSNVPLPKSVRVFPSKNRPQFEPLAVWLGDGAPPAGYINVIPGFRDATLGLKVGETATVRLAPERAFQDGHERLFEVTVLAIEPPT
ncbi:MAG TPA: peptidylprolyl isomerase [Candidatus Thermoplasmatota archaeon]|nr:peptidylprolyl isomerase [Candidatus Thermoplasmatota archaeon]